MAKDSEWTISDLTDMKNQDFPHEVKIARELKIEKRMQKITIAVTAVFGCILLYAILYKPLF